MIEILIARLFNYPMLEMHFVLIDKGHYLHKGQIDKKWLNVGIYDLQLFLQQSLTNNFKRIW
jgi:hypothetical protein